MKKSLVLLIVILLGLLPRFSKATHLMGGEITWVSIKSGADSGKFQFKVRFYRDCNGIPAPGSITLTTNAPGLAGGILCNPIQTTDLSPVGPGCPTCAAPANQVTAVLEVLYQSAPITITGVPPSTGWYFYYSDCCRNAAIVNLGAGGGNFTLRAIMYPYNAQSTNPSFDSSPQFLVSPTLAACLGDTMRYTQGAFDPELDSLTYSWDHPLDNGWPGTNYPFIAGYSYNSPLPGVSVTYPNNMPAILNPVTGIVTFKADGPAGGYVTCTKVTSWKCGQKTAEVFREIQISLAGNCNIPFAIPERNASPIVEVFNCMSSK